MSESSPENEQSSGQSEQSGQSPGDEEGVGISDSQLPEDLQPADDNPLAKPPSDDDEDSGMSLSPDGPEA